MEIVGYARVSTLDQKLDLQLDALKKYGCTKIVTEKKSAAKERPEREKMLKALQDGDTLVVWRLDRIGRSMVDIINTVHGIGLRGVKFVSITDHIDTSTPNGRLWLNIIASFAEYERELIIDRTRTGLEAARARGKKGGRKPGISLETQLKVQQVKKLSKNKAVKVADICRKFKISKKTYYRWQDTPTPDLEP